MTAVLRLKPLSAMNLMDAYRSALSVAVVWGGRWHLEPPVAAKRMNHFSFLACRAPDAIFLLEPRRAALRGQRLRLPGPVMRHCTPAPPQPNAWRWLASPTERAVVVGFPNRTHGVKNSYVTKLCSLCVRLGAQCGAVCSVGDLDQAPHTPRQPWNGAAAAGNMRHTPGRQQRPSVPLLTRLVAGKLSDALYRIRPQMI